MVTTEVVTRESEKRIGKVRHEIKSELQEAGLQCVLQVRALSCSQWEIKRLLSRESGGNQFKTPHI
jgi:hypothetical protein